MTLEEFSEITKTRIPTPAEFIAFAKGQQWSFVLTADGKPALKAPPQDPLVLAFAKMLSREPYRTNVLALIALPLPQVAPEPYTATVVDETLEPEDTRDQAIQRICTRAGLAKKKVFGFSTGKASCAELNAKAPVPDEWDRMCVEGDVEWLNLPSTQ